MNQMTNNEDFDSEKMTNIKLVILQLLLQTEQVINSKLIFFILFRLYLNVKSKKILYINLKVYLVYIFNYGFNSILF